MGKLLTPEQCESYRRDGFLSAITAMSTPEALAYRRALEEAEAKFGAMHYVTKPHLLLRLPDELVHYGAILDAPEDITRPNILLFDSPFFITHPPDANY